MSRTLRIAQYLVRLAALPERIQTLVRKYPGVTQEMVQAMATVDPTGLKGSYLEWMVRRVKAGEINNVSYYNLHLLQVILATFHKIANSKDLRIQYGVSRDISGYSLQDIYNLHERYQHDIHGKESIKAQGSKKIYDDGVYKIIEVNSDSEYGAKAACLYAENSRWCTRKLDVAESYLQDGPLYIIFLNGDVFAQFSGLKRELKDLKNQDIPLDDSNRALFWALVEVGLYPRSVFYFEYARVTGKRDPEGEKEIARDAQLSVEYADKVLHGRFTEAEPLILKSPYLAEEYVSHLRYKRDGYEQLSSLYEDYPGLVREMNELSYARLYDEDGW